MVIFIITMQIKARHRN